MSNVEMPRTPVESSNIKSIGFDKNTLQVEFTNGAVYNYTPITEDCYKELMSAESKGEYFYQNIRKNENVTLTKVKPKLK